MSEEGLRIARLGPGESMVQFPGKSNWDALVDHHCLDLTEEDDFIRFLEANGTAPGRLDLEELEHYYQEWRRLGQGC